MQSAVQAETTAASCCVVLVPDRAALRAPVEGVLTRTIAELLRQGKRQFVVDLHRVETIDAAGIGALVVGLVAARQRGGTLRIARPTRRVRRLLQIAGVLTVLSPLSHREPPTSAQASSSTPRVTPCQAASA